MKGIFFRFWILPFCLLGLSLICSVGCARYHATALSSVCPDAIHTTAPSDGLIVAAKAFSKADCKRYLDRDLISKGFQPIQLYIENVSDKTYLFSTSRVNLPLCPPEEVAKKAHTSTLARIGGYGAAAIFASPLFVIPAVIDGLGSSRANSVLDHDFAEKSAKDQLIPPYTHKNMLLFIPIDSTQDSFVVTLLDEETNKPKRLLVRVSEG